MEGCRGIFRGVVNVWVDVTLLWGFVLILVEGIYDVWECEFWTVFWVWLGDCDVAMLKGKVYLYKYWRGCMKKIVVYGLDMYLLNYRKVGL